MITLNRWFQENANRPLGVVALLVILVWAVLFVGFLNETAYRQVEGTKQLANLLSLSFSQKNRVLTESLLASSHESLAAQSAIICRGNIAVISSNANNSDCERAGSWFSPRVTSEIPGTDEHRLVIFFSIFKDRSAVWNFIFLGLAFAAVSFWLLRQFKRRLYREILAPLEAGLLDDKPMLIAEFEQIRQKRKLIEESKEREAALQAVLENKSKVAHNIKSPLRTLRLVQQSIKELISERDSRLLGGVIDSINNILGDQQSAFIQSIADRTIQEVTPSTQTREPVLLSDFLEETLAQKSAEYIHLKNVSLSIRRSENLFGVFVNVVKHEFRAILSNLVNNAIDAVGAKKGKVTIEAFLKDGSIHIRVNDDGSGVPEERRDKIFEKGITFKNGGTGFGLYHARQYLSQWNGSIECSNLPMGGASFEISLPVSKTPDWFANRIELLSKKHILIVDDDSLIYKVWTDRLAPLLDKQAVKIHFAANESEFEARLGEIAAEISESIILCDYDLSLRNRKTGLDIVRSYGVAALTTLVTNNFQSAELIQQCRKEQIRILPKPCIDSVPITT